MMVGKPVLLCILDGWGNGPATADNAIRLTPTPNYDIICERNPQAELLTSSGDVGLPAGQMGNSEVGHQNLGAGRVVLQDLPRIDAAVADGSLASKPELTDFIAALKASGGACHMPGLLSPGGVHSHQDHMLVLAKAVAAAEVPVKIHAFLDGRDTPPRSANGFMADFLAGLSDDPLITIATVSGRYYAMDRDKRWERVSRAYDAMTLAEGQHAGDATEAIALAYSNDLSDEFAEPTVIGDFQGMQDGDGLLMANFRADRAREILTALLDPAFDGFARAKQVTFAAALGMVSYSNALDKFLPALFAPESLGNTLGEVVSRAGRKQLRIAETEKYAHVTFFLNGGEERVFDGEERILIPSPKVATYDLQPEMSAPEVTENLVMALNSRRFDLIVVNYANPDMVGHTGIMSAAQEAVRCIDDCLGELEKAVRDNGYVMLITADHGNIEQMVDPASGEAHTAHTRNAVPFIMLNGPGEVKLASGRLADVAPTILALMGLDQPQEMTGSSLLRHELMEGSGDHRRTA